jgi:hypothetical protein
MPFDLRSRFEILVREGDHLISHIRFGLRMRTTRYGALSMTKATHKMWRSRPAILILKQWQCAQGLLHIAVQIDDAPPVG